MARAGTGTAIAGAGQDPGRSPADARVRGTPSPLRVPAEVAAGEGRGPLSAADWIAAASALLVGHSIDGVRVDALARALGVTRGSFYWHFRDRDDLLQRLLDDWHDRATEDLIVRFESTHVDPREQLLDVASLPFRGRTAARAASVELAIRAWARRDERARVVVERVDGRRIEHIARCFVALGRAPAEARSRAFVLLGYMMSEALMGAQGSASERAARRALAERLLIGER